MDLRRKSAPEWLDAVLGDFDAFLLDHAACERKASATAMSLVAHYPDRPELVGAMIDLAAEELEHFRRVWRRLAERGLTLGPDQKDPYVVRLQREYRKGSREYFLDRLLVSGIVEARGCERFGLVAAALPAGDLRDFYREIARSEVRHRGIFLELSRVYFDDSEIGPRLDELLEVEARVLAELPPRAAVH